MLMKNSAIYGAEALDYSLDGKMIVISRNSEVSDNPLWLMSYDGSNSHPIPINGTYKDAYKNLIFNSVKWLSDQKHIQFTVWDGSKGTIYVTDINGVTPIATTSHNP